MAFTILNAILHIINNNNMPSTYSRAELDIDSEICHEFIHKHARRLLSNPAAREATFTAESKLYGLVTEFFHGRMHFHHLSVEICRHLEDVIAQNPDIPSADVLVTHFENRGDRYLAILKLNYGECFTHQVVEDGGEPHNHIVKNTAVLPLSSRVEEACLIPFAPMVLRVMEKPFEVNGELCHYFSQLFLECEAQLSKKETAKVIEEIAEEINQVYYDGDVEMAAKVKHAIIAEAEELPEDEVFSLDNVARRVFEAEAPARTEFVEKAREAGLPHDLPLEKKFVRQQFKMQSFKADNGIEVKCPTELFTDPEAVQITNNSDGTVSITLRNLRRS